MQLSPWLASALLLASTTLYAQTSASFEMSRDVNPAIAAESVAVGDFNNDGKPDVILAGSGGDNQLALQLGNGDGTFQAPVTFATLSTPEEMTAVDVNKDGNVDLICLVQDLNSGTGSIVVFYGNGNGTFKAPVTYSTPYLPYSMGVHDLNGDGYPDIAVGDDIGQVEIWNNNGGASYTLAKNVLVNANQEHESKVRVGQFNGNGIYDLAVMNGLGVWVLWNDGKENFTSQELKGYQAPQDMNVGDLNQDGIDDIIQTWGCPSTSQNGAPVGCASIDVFYGQGNNKFYKNTVVSNVRGMFAPIYPWAADVNGDGVADIVGEAVPGPNSQPGLYVWLGNPNGSYDHTPEIWYSSSGAAGALAPGDFNRDGMVDFVQNLPGDGETEFFINGGMRGPCTTSTINPTVTVCEPVTNTYLPNPVTVKANAYDKNTVTSMQEYIDGKLDYKADVTSFTQSFNLAAGTHQFVTKAWDDTGLSFRSDRTVTVYNGTPGPACSVAHDSAKICLPAGSTTTSPVRIVANGWPPYIPSAAQLYIDGDLVVNNQGCNSEGACYGGTSYVDITKNLSSGTHNLVFKVYDTDGNEYTAQKTVTVN